MIKLIYTFLGLLSIFNCIAQDTEVLRALYDNSDVVVQGIIVSEKCIGYAIGVEECSYKIDVDSIYKGHPKLHSNHLINPGPLKSLHFARQRWSGENPLRGQQVILFLNKIQNKESNQEGYKLIDRFLGVHLYSWPLAHEIRRIKILANNK